MYMHQQLKVDVYCLFRVKYASHAAGVAGYMPQPWWSPPAGPVPCAPALLMPRHAAMMQAQPGSPFASGHPMSYGPMSGVYADNRLMLSTCNDLICLLPVDSYA